MELKGHACLQAWQRCQPISKWSSEGWQDLLSPLSSYSCSFFQFRFSPGTLPLPEQQVSETLTDPYHPLWVRRALLKKGAFSTSLPREGEQLLQ